MTNNVVKLDGSKYSASDYLKSVADGYTLPESTMMYHIQCTGNVDPKGVLYNAIEDDPQGVSLVSIDDKGNVSVASGYLSATDSLVLLKRGVEILEGILNERVENNARFGSWYDSLPSKEEYFGYTDEEEDDDDQ